MKKWMLALCVTGLTTGAVTTEFGFVPNTNQLTGSWADSVAVGDINADGQDDIVLATTFYFDEANDYSVFIYRQLPDGSLSSPQKIKYADGTSGSDVEIADMNNDGINDILVGRSGGFTLFTATTGGVFQRHDLGDQDCISIVAPDVDVDGNTDVVCQSWANGAVVHYGNGLGGIRSSTPLATGAQGYNDIKSGDVTGDGMPDLVITSAQSQGVYVYPNNGSGFGSGLTYPRPDTIWSIGANAIGDFNADGRNDVAVAVASNSPESSIWIYSQDNSGRLGAPVRMPSMDIPEAMVASDLDGNGRQDLLVSHHGWSSIGWYMQKSTGGLNPEVVTRAPSNGWANPLAIGDINDDGCVDVAFSDYNAGLSTLLGRNCILPVRRAYLADDFNGDGKSDLFWRSTSNGTNAIWRSANYATPQLVTSVTNTAWSVIGTGDFNGDKKADLLWHNPATGTNAIWRSANQATPQPVTQITDPLWKIVGVGDFDGDGKHDLLWRHDASGRNAIWRSGDFATQRSVMALSDTQWQVAGVGDFNADGRDDILWHNASTRSNMVWPSGDFWKQRYITKVSNSAWVIAGVGDFDGDKHSDILWRDTAAGTNAIWKQGYYARQQPVSPQVDTSWQVVATGDYDGDGKHDVAWRNTTTGENVVWKSANAHTPLDTTDITNLQWMVQP